MLKKRLNPVYLIFLLFPIVYGLLWNHKTVAPSIDDKLNDYFYFSAKASNAATLCLIAGKDTLNKWELNSKGFKILQFVGHVNDSNGLKITVSNLHYNDTITLLGFNLFRNQKLYSITEGSAKCMGIENATQFGGNTMLNAIVEQSNKPVTIELKPSSNWETNDNSHQLRFISILIFTFGFLLIIVFAPPLRYFIVSLLISLLIMITSYLADLNPIDRVSVSDDSQLKGAEIYYSNSPFFNPYKRFSSGGDTSEFKIPLNLEIDNFIRCDVDGSMRELKDFKIKIKAGIYSSALNINSLPQLGLVLNDVVLRGETYYITGDDPFFGLTSTYFIHHINYLLFLKHNLFLFIALFAFLILVIMHPFMGNLKRILKNVRFRFAHLTILLIPLSYFFITHTWIPEKASNCSDQIYFSAHTSKPSVISLFNGKDSLTSWALNSQGYKYLPFTGPINLSASLYLKIENLSERDTFSLLSINLFHDDNVYSLFDKNENVCTIKNAVLSDKSDEINAIVQQTNEPLIVNLLPFSVLKKDSPKHVVYIIIIFILIGTYILVLILSPRAVYIISTSLLASALMFFYFWVCNDMQYQVTISTKSKLDRVDFFYNNNPVFSSKNDIIVEERNDYFKSQVDLEVFNFLRCDVDEKTKELSDFQICTKTGILRNSWDYSSLASDRILMNDMIRNGGKFYICGSDPYFALTSSFQIQSIRWISLLRQNIFFLLTIFLFLILISAHKLAEKHNLVTFFFVIAFLVIISFALIVRLFNSDRITLKSEMRNSNPIPVFQLDSSEIFIQKLDDYLKDQLPGRNNLVIMNNLVEYSIFRELINNPIVHFGKDGWLYFIGGAAKENYENRYPLSPQELKKMKEVLIARRDWLHKRGIHFYVIFPPLTHFIYEENIGPRMWRYNQKSKIDQLLEYLKLNSNLDVIDIYNPLMEEKKKGKMQLYFKDNCHWSYKGGYVAYDAVIKYIKNDFQNVGNPIDYNEIIWTELKGYTPDLMRLLAIDKYFSFHECFPVFKYKIPTDTIYPVYYGVGSPIRPFCLNTKRDDRPSMLMYGDSYSACILSFLNNNFDRTIFVGTHFFYPSIIEKEKPDIVIQEMADGTIYDLLLQNPPLPEMNDSMKIQNYSKNKKLKF